MMIKRAGFLIALIVIFALPLLASGGEEAHHIPTVIYYQALNLGLLLFGLHLWQRKALQGYFSQRQQTFLAARTQALHQRKEAEKRHSDIENRLKSLSSAADETVENARKEAEALRIKLVEEANEIAQRLRQEAEKTAQFELEKAVHRLRENMIDEAMGRSRAQMENLGEVERLALQKEFVQKIQVVQS